MLNSLENKRARHAQSPKNSEMDILLLFRFCRSGSSKNIRREHINRSPNWSFARLDATLLSAVPARGISHFSHARG